MTRWAEAIGAVLRSVRPWRCPHARRLRLGRSQWECLDCRCLGVETGL